MFILQFFVFDFSINLCNFGAVYVPRITEGGTRVVHVLGRLIQKQQILYPHDVIKTMYWKCIILGLQHLHHRMHDASSQALLAHPKKYKNLYSGSCRRTCKNCVECFGKSHSSFAYHWNTFPLTSTAMGLMALAGRGRWMPSGEVLHRQIC